MAGLLRYLLAGQQWPHHRAFEAATRRPAEAQARVLRVDPERERGHRLRAGARLRHDPDAGRLRPAVPVRDYEALRPYVARVVAGEARVLTAEAPFDVRGRRAAPTGEPKFIPVTPGWARAMASLMRLWTFHALRDHPAMLDHHVLTLVGPAVRGAHARRRAVRRDDRAHVSATALADPAPPRPALRRRPHPRLRDALLRRRAPGAGPRDLVHRDPEPQHAPAARRDRRAPRARPDPRRPRRDARRGRTSRPCRARA